MKKTGEKETGKNQILEEVCQAKQRPTMIHLQHDAVVQLGRRRRCIHHTHRYHDHKTCSTTNVNASVNPFPAAHAHVPVIFPYFVRSR